MTAPVINNLDNEDSNIAFVMPKEYSLEELPLTLQPDLKFKQIPERYVSTITFSGNINQDVIQNKNIEVIEWLKEKQITTIGSIEIARYNPLFIPGIFKKNELLVEVKAPVE